MAISVRGACIRYAERESGSVTPLLTTSGGTTHRRCTHGVRRNGRSRPARAAGYTPLVKLSRIIINGVALIAAALIVPGIKLDWGHEPTRTLITLFVLAVVFGIINTYIRPVLRAISLPVNLISMGLFGFFLNAGLLLLLAWLVDKLGQSMLHVGGFPPNISTTTITAAVAGSLVITVVSTFLSVLLPDA